jgi:ABC-type multidrug transport system ATPase subunit
MPRAAGTPVLEVQGLQFGWPGVALFQDLHLQIPAGVSLVHGDESCGKTTLLRLLCGDLQAERGSLVLRHVALGKDPQTYRAQVFCTQPRSHALDDISARAWFETLPSKHPGFDVRNAMALSHGFALEPHLDKPMYMLSAGSQRKVWLSAAFAAGTALTLIDEPFAALDIASIRFLRSLLHEASEHPSRAWVLADHAPPEGLALQTQLMLGG